MELNPIKERTSISSVKDEKQIQEEFKSLQKNVSLIADTSSRRTKSFKRANSTKCEYQKRRLSRTRSLNEKRRFSNQPTDSSNSPLDSNWSSQRTSKSSTHSSCYSNFSSYSGQSGYSANSLQRNNTFSLLRNESSRISEISVIPDEENGSRKSLSPLVKSNSSYKNYYSKKFIAAPDEQVCFINPFTENLYKTDSDEEKRLEQIENLNKIVKIKRHKSEKLKRIKSNNLDSQASFASANPNSSHPNRRRCKSNDKKFDFSDKNRESSYKNLELRVSQMDTLTVPTLNRFSISKRNSKNSEKSNHSNSTYIPDFLNLTTTDSEDENRISVRRKSSFAQQKDNKTVTNSRNPSVIPAYADETFGVTDCRSSISKSRDVIELDTPKLAEKITNLNAVIADMNKKLLIALENREKLRNEKNAKMTDLEDVYCLKF